MTQFPGAQRPGPNRHFQHYPAHCINWDLASSLRYGRASDSIGFECALTQIRFTASYGATSKAQVCLFRRSHSAGRVATQGDRGATSRSGDFYHFRGYKFSPRLVQKPHLEMFQSGNSDDVRHNGAEVADRSFTNDNALEGFRRVVCFRILQSIGLSFSSTSVRFRILYSQLIRQRTSVRIECRQISTAQRTPS